MISITACCIHTLQCCFTARPKKFKSGGKKNHLFPSLFLKSSQLNFPEDAAFLLFACKSCVSLGHAMIKRQEKEINCNSKLLCNVTHKKKKMFYGLHEVYVNSRALIWHGEHIHACCCRDLPVVTLATHSENLCGCSITSLKRWALAIHITSLEMNNLTTPSHL